MITITKLALSLLVAGSALGFSALNSAEKNKDGVAKRAGAITADFLVQPVVDVFEQFPTGIPVGTDCLSTSQRHCFYSVSSVGKDSIPNLPNYTTTQIDVYVLKGWLSPGPGSISNKLYIP